MLSRFSVIESVPRGPVAHWELPIAVGIDLLVKCAVEAGCCVVLCCEVLGHVTWKILELLSMAGSCECRTYGIGCNICVYGVITCTVKPF